MKIIILAAGKGERLLPLTRNTPKSLLDLANGNTLIEEQIDRMRRSGVIDEIVLVVGYLAEQIEAKLKKLINSGFKVRTIFNPFFDTSNNLISLWLAMPEMGEDFLVTNGDNLFSPDVFRGLVNSSAGGIVLSICCKQDYNEEDMKVLLEGDQVVRVSKLIESNFACAESPGLAMVRGEKWRNLFREHLDLLVRDQNCVNSFWLEVFNYLHERGIAVCSWGFEGRDQWQEIDFHIDVSNAKKLLSPKPLARSQKPGLKQRIEA